MRLKADDGGYRFVSSEYHLTVCHTITNHRQLERLEYECIKDVGAQGDSSSKMLNHFNLLLEN
jgi:hypothetical protein